VIEGPEDSERRGGSGEHVIGLVQSCRVAIGEPDRRDVLFQQRPDHDLGGMLAGAFLPRQVGCVPAVEVPEGGEPVASVAVEILVGPGVGEFVERRPPHGQGVE
jgi:hypothetical protein